MGARAHWVVDHRTVAFGELQANAHGLDDQQNIGKENRGVHAEPFHRSDRHLGGQIWTFTESEERHLLAERTVLGHVTPGLAHQPHGRVRRGFATAGLQENRLLHRETSYHNSWLMAYSLWLMAYSLWQKLYAIERPQ